MPRNATCRAPRQECREGWLASRNTPHQLFGCGDELWEGKWWISSPPALFAVVFLIQRQLNACLGALQSREGEDKGESSWGGLSREFLNQHRVVSLKVHPSGQNGSNCRPLKRNRENQVAFGMGKAAGWEAGGRTHREGGAASFLLLLRNGSLQRHAPARPTGSCPVLWRITYRPARCSAEGGL